ncbi:hypothetical protein GGI35DRAFT_421096 [Trichoderma velutinum]
MEKKKGTPRPREKKNLLSSMPALFAESNPTPNDASNEAPASNGRIEGWGRWRRESCRPTKLSGLKKIIRGGKGSRERFRRCPKCSLLLGSCFGTVRTKAYSVQPLGQWPRIGETDAKGTWGEAEPPHLHCARTDSQTDQRPLGNVWVRVPYQPDLASAVRQP